MKNKGHETWLRRWFLRAAGIAAAVVLVVAIMVGAAFSAQAAKSSVPIAHCWSVYENAERDIAKIWDEIHISRAVRIGGHVANRFANRETLTWTRTDTQPGGLTCITDGGEDYDGPFPEKAP